MAGDEHAAPARKRLLIVYHSQSGNTARLAEAALTGARRVTEVDSVMRRAFDAGVDDLRAADALLLATPENFGYMSGALKDFFDRTYYPVEGQMQGTPYAVLISAGNDGRGAEREIGRIATGYGWRQAADTLIVRGAIDDTHLLAARELGEALASGLALGIF